MSKPKVYVTRQLFDEALEVLECHAEVEVFEGVDEAIPRDLLLSKVAGVEEVIVVTPPGQGDGSVPDVILPAPTYPE